MFTMFYKERASDLPTVMHVHPASSTIAMLLTDYSASLHILEVVNFAVCIINIIPMVAP